MSHWRLTRVGRCSRMPASYPCLTASETSQGGFVIPPQPTGESDLIGRNGKTLTVLHPTGKIEVNNNTLDVVTEGEYIEKGQIVEIIEISGNRIVVKII